MKKKPWLLIIGIVILTIGVIIYNFQKRNNVEYFVDNGILSREEATKLVEETLNNIINIYENKEKVFNIDKSVIKDKYIKVTNYNEIVKDIFTENGIVELENMTFEKNKFVLKEENNIYLFDSIPRDNKLLDCSVTLDNFDIKKNEINCDVTLTTYGLKNDIMTYYVIEKNIKLVKKDDNWLVETFKYSNN